MGINCCHVFLLVRCSGLRSLYHLKMLILGAFPLDSPFERNTTMNKQATTILLKETPLSKNDAARLALEACEELGERVEGLNHRELMCLLRRVLRAGIEILRQGEETVNFAEAVRQSLAARSHLRPTSRRNLKNYTNRMLRVPGVAARPLRAMNAKECRALLSAAFPNSLSSYHKGRAILHSIFAFGVRQEWCDRNPVDAVESPRLQERTKHPLTRDEVQRLLHAVQQPRFSDMRFALHLMLYNGIRPTEVCRLRVEDVNEEEKSLTIRPQTSKTGGGRIVPLRVRCKERQLPLHWRQRWRALHLAAGFSRWVPDVLRHTFASYYAAYFRNMQELQWEMGHRDSQLLRSRYVSPVSRRAAIAFWKA